MTHSLPAARKPVLILVVALVVALAAALMVVVTPTPAQAANTRGVSITIVKDGDATGVLQATLRFTKRGIGLSGTSQDLCPGNGWGLQITGRTLLRGGNLGAQKFRYNGNGCDAGKINFSMFVKQKRVRGARIYFAEYKAATATQGAQTRLIYSKDYVR